MKRLLSSLLVLALLVGFSFTSDAAPKKAAKVKPTVGKVASLKDYLALGTETITKDEAVQQAEKGNPIVLLEGKGKSLKVYIILNEDGSFGGKNLAKYAANKQVAVYGAKKVKAGINYILAEKIESFD